jgi:hypothetical protein
MTEGQLQDAIRLVLGANPDGVWWRNNVGVAEFKGSLVRYGLANGSADLVGIYKGRFVALEVKVPTGRQTPEQVRWGQLVERKGGIYRVLRSVDDAHALLAELAAL